MTDATSDPGAAAQSGASQPGASQPGASQPGAARRGDLTQGPILRTLLLFSIPTLLSNVLQTLNGSVNAVWVGRLIGESALAATANANVITFLLFSAVFGFGMATTVKVGQHYGARNIDAARRTFGAGTGFCTLLSLAVAIAGWFASPQLLRLMATPGASMAEADAYLRVIFLSLPFGTLTMMLSMGLRGAGDARTPLYAMILTVVIDIAFNPLLIRGIGPIPPLGIAGSALSTAIANLAGVVLLVVVLYRKDLPLRLRGAELAYLRPVASELGYIVTKGLPMGAQMLLIAAAQLVMVGLVNREGLDTTAAYGASMQLWNYLQMPAFAIGSAVSAMVAQSIGADDHRRAAAVTLYGVAANLIMTGVLAVLIVGFDRPLLALFLGHDSPAIPIARHIQLICTWSFMLSGVMMVMTGTMRAYGAVMLPLVILFIAFYPARMGFYFSVYHLIGSEALWWSYPASSAVALGLTVLAYTRGGWRKNRTGIYPGAAPAAAGRG
ncbi:MATE family efflux transporter [Novosphingobium piscinae]|uniref:MATE family efflux transporter n=1 Tax=Novosphingobium piscinae TaxID=1507448 RepID=A0A7X1KR80_9SPHN|nr:MATE family efflux transporter [Novosphingobium piscinae]MBC2670437.1 MATE family efflux transporter [Novosphingobium piscinae]